MDVKSNKQDIAAISKRVKKELLEAQSFQSEYLISIRTFTYCLTSIGAKSNEEVFAARIKQLTGECHCSLLCDVPVDPFSRECGLAQGQHYQRKCCAHDTTTRERLCRQRLQPSRSNGPRRR